MKLVTSFFGSSASSKKEGKQRKMRNKSTTSTSSFSSTTSSSSSSDETAPSDTTPRSVLPSASASFEKEKKPTPAPVAVTREELEAALRRVVTSEAELAEMLAEAAAVLGEEVAEVAAPTDEGELRDTFAVFDADSDGRISAEELREVLAALGDDACSVEDCRRMIRGVDTDGDGFVCFKEFTRMMMH